MTYSKPLAQRERTQAVSYRKTLIFSYKGIAVRKRAATVIGMTTTLFPTDTLRSEHREPEHRHRPNDYQLEYWKNRNSKLPGAEVVTFDNNGQTIEFRRLVIDGAIWMGYDQETGTRLGSPYAVRNATDCFDEGVVRWVVGPAFITELGTASPFSVYEITPQTAAAILNYFSEDWEWWTYKIGGEVELRLRAFDRTLARFVAAKHTYQRRYSKMKHPGRSKKVAEAALAVERWQAALNENCGLDDGECELAVELYDALGGDFRRIYETILAVRG